MQNHVGALSETLKGLNNLTPGFNQEY